MDWKQVERIYVAKSEDDPMLFIRGLKIPSAHGPVRFQSCATQFQLDCFADLAPSLIAVRNGTMPPVRSCGERSVARMRSSTTAQRSGRRCRSR